MYTIVPCGRPQILFILVHSPSLEALSVSNPFLRHFLRFCILFHTAPIRSWSLLIDDKRLHFGRVMSRICFLPVPIGINWLSEGPCSLLPIMCVRYLLCISNHVYTFQKIWLYLPPDRGISMDYRSPPYHSSHYAQAYRKQQCQSISHQESTQQITFQNLQLSQLQPFQQVAPPMNYRQMSAWYQAGGSHCTYRNCKFAGSKRVVETHMMDRHLIYPPGWDPKKSSTWDADPSLKGWVNACTYGRRILKFY